MALFYSGPYRGQTTAALDVPTLIDLYRKTSPKLHDLCRSDYWGHHQIVARELARRGVDAAKLMQRERSDA